MILFGFYDLEEPAEGLPCAEPEAAVIACACGELILVLTRIRILVIESESLRSS